MGLEHSVLNEQKIIELLKTYWSIAALRVEKLPLGSANCYRVTCKSECYFLKEFQSNFTTEDLVRELRFASR